MSRWSRGEFELVSSNILCVLADGGSTPLKCAGG